MVILAVDKPNSVASVHALHRPDQLIEQKACNVTMIKTLHLPHHLVVRPIRDPTVRVTLPDPQQTVKFVRLLLRMDPCNGK
jgi:hypothetical protein